MITYQTEVISDELIAELKPLLSAHYEEIAWRKDVIKLDPDFDKYRKLELLGSLCIYTAREDGALIGYAIFILSLNLHYRIKQASNDIFYVEPTKRGALVGKRLLREYSESELAAQGVKVINLHIKRSHDWTKLAERWGYEHTEANCQKWLGDDYGV